MPDITAALLLLRKPIEAVASVSTGKASDLLAKMKATSSLKNIYQKLNSTQKVKTIWNVERAITLNSFYFPTRIKTKSGATQAIVSLNELPGNAVVLSGTVGQGKSILLRYLLGKEMKSGERLPVLIELRRTPPKGLNQYLRETFNEIVGISGHPEVFDLFATTGRLSILLDGFDEIDPERASEITTAIEAFAENYPEARLIVTSRPSAGIETSPHFDIIHIAQLAPSDFSGFFHKILPKDKPLADRITKAVLSSPLQVKSLASTPLLATLLTIVYRAQQKIPADFSEFYDELFQILLVRHDRSKSGYERRRKTSLSDRQIQQVFEAFCFKAKAEGQSSLTKDKALKLSANSISAQELTCQEDDFIVDIVKVTCLLQEEGGRIEFLHESVKEFFAARYVASRPEDAARKFYALVLSGEKWRNWEQVLKFLSQIDRYRSNQYFFIPALTGSLNALKSVNSTATRLALRAAVSDQIVVRQRTLKADGTRDQALNYSVVSLAGTSLYCWDALFTTLVNSHFRSAPLIAGDWRAAFDRTTDGQTLSLTRLADKAGKGAALDDCLRAAVAAIRDDLHSRELSVAVLDSSADFMGV